MLSIVDKVLFLLQLPATAAATTDALSRLALAAEELERAPGELLFAVGDTPDALWVLVSGVVHLEGAAGATRVEGGAPLGALALLQGGAHERRAVVARPARLLRVDRRELELLLDEDGEFARALFTGLMRALRLTAPSLFAA